MSTRAAAAALAILCASIASGRDARAEQWFAPQAAVRPDGLTMIVDPTPARLASLRVVVLAGALADPQQKQGVAHLVAQLVSSSTPTRNIASLGARLDRLAARPVVSVGIDATTFGIDVPPALFDEAARLLLASISTPRLSDGALAAELKVLAADAFGADDASNAIARLYPVFQTSGLAGSENSRSAITLDAIKGFYRTHYRPEGMMVIATGAVTFEKVQRAVSDAFLIPARPDERPPAASTMPKPKLPAVFTGRSRTRHAWIGNRFCTDESTVAACAVLAEIARGRALARLHARVDPGAQVSGGLSEAGGHRYLLLDVAASTQAATLEHVGAVLSELGQNPSAQEVKRALDAMTVAARRRRAHPNLLADAYAAHAAAGRRSASAIAEFESAARAATPEQLGAVAKSVVSPAQLFSLELSVSETR